ncbi:MAG: ATP-dependent Clp protease proteolytic subunit [Thiomargarita sp.]|nr:ATP-dependent Clp protease proteolytic subunit [Thiomargarita sp.]
MKKLLAILLVISGFAFQVSADDNSVQVQQEKITSQVLEKEILVSNKDVNESVQKNSVKQETEQEKLQNQLNFLKLQHSILATQNLIKTERYKQELLELQQEKDKLLLQNELESELHTAKQMKKLKSLEDKKAHLELENEIREQEKLKTFSDLEKERQRLEAENLLLEELNKKEELKIQLESARLNFELSKLELERSKGTIELEAVSQKIMEREQQELWDSQVNRPKKYLKEPYFNGRLIISDRKIELGRVIFRGTADYVNERIDYFNNKSGEYPIFLIIDLCYGGSVMEGSKILEAMHASKAPVYVVVKTFAASMAATIATLAERSYSYPNALILHHQVFSFAWGNQKELRERLKITDEWTRRIIQPVAEKMGITMDEFVEKMYENNSTGDWIEFADSAAKLKWIDTIIKDIKDVSVTKQPVEKNGRVNFFMLQKTPFKEQVDSSGQAYIKLPPLNPLDYYYLYNPNNYYR